MTRRSFMKRARNATVGGLIGSGIGVLTTDGNDTPQEETAKVGGGALTGVAIGAMIGKSASREPQAPEPTTTRRGFMEHAGRRVKIMATGGVVGSGLGVLSIEKSDSPDTQTKKVAGGAIAGAAVAVAVDDALHRDTDAARQRQDREFREKREWANFAQRRSREDPKDRDDRSK